MKTLYIDVYFLINLTVDLLSLHVSSLFFHLPLRVWRLVLAGTVGAFFATAAVLCAGHGVLLVFCTVLGFVSMILLTAGGVRFFRMARFAFGFLLSEILIGGLVYFFYGILGDAIKNIGLSVKGGAENRKLLILSILVLLSVGVLRLVVASLSGTCSERFCSVSFDFFSVAVQVDALVDSGNLLRDPLDGTPVMLWKASDLTRRLPGGSLPKTPPPAWKSRLRLIPVHGEKSRILTGYRIDGVLLSAGRKKEKVNLIIAIDEEDGTFGGFCALLPSAVLDVC